MARILIIDDATDIRSMFKRYLERKGYLVTTAADGGQGLSAFAAEMPDLVITDLMMPEMDGLEVICAIRKQQPDLPVIAISGGIHADPENYLPVAGKYGANRVFEKPVDLEQLRSAIQDLLGDKASPPA